MTAATEARSPSASSGFLYDLLHSNWKGIVVPYVLCIAAQFPYLLIYFSQIYKLRPHYQFFPFAVIATGLAIYLRWPRTQAHPFRSSLLSNFFFMLGCLFGMSAALFNNPWFSAVSSYSFVTSFCARTKDGETGRTMLSASFPLWIALALPLNLDFALITWLQVFSAQAASHVLDLFGYFHHLAGTVLVFPEKTYGVEEACSGVTSFFTLLFMSTVFVVYLHRPWFRSMLLLMSALFWALLMNAIRILVIPIAHITFGLDLASGFPHALLGYTTLAIGGLLVLSTDQFLTFLFGPVEPTTIDSSNEAVGKVTGFWNRVFAGDPERAAKARSKLPSRFARGMIVAGSALMLLIGVASIGTAVQMLTSGYIVKFFKNSETIALEKADLQPSIGRWAWIPETETVKPYMFSLRKAGSDLGLRSDQWTYQDGPRLAMVALDQPFPGWHELTRCYQNNGWTLVENGRKYQPAKDKKFDKEWPYIQVELTKPTGEKGFLLFSFFDVNGQPFDAPTDWGAVNKLLIRIRNRLSPAVRARLFNEESFQVQAFIQSPRALTDKERQDAAENYLELREQIRSAFLQRRAKGPSAGTTAVANSEAKQ